MKKVQIQCDRCGKLIEALIDGDGKNGATMTAGYYIVSEGSNWSDYARWEEEYVCDDCMHADPKYIAIYGDIRPK